MGIKIVEKISKAEIKKIIKSSAVSKQDKGVWNNFIDKVNDKTVESLIQVLKDDSKNLKFLTTVLKNKTEAIEKQDKTAWSKIIKDEKKYLASCK